MFYEIEGRYYTKIGPNYQEICITIDKHNRILFTPTDNKIPAIVVGHNYNLISSDTVRVKYINKTNKNNEGGRQL